MQAWHETDCIRPNDTLNDCRTDLAVLGQPTGHQLLCERVCLQSDEQVEMRACRGVSCNISIWMGDTWWVRHETSQRHDVLDARHAQSAARLHKAHATADMEGRLVAAARRVELGLVCAARPVLRLRERRCPRPARQQLARYPLCGCARCLGVAVAGTRLAQQAIVDTLAGHAVAGRFQRFEGRERRLGRQHPLARVKLFRGDWTGHPAIASDRSASCCFSVRCTYDNPDRQNQKSLKRLGST